MEIGDRAMTFIIVIIRATIDFQDNRLIDANFMDSAIDCGWIEQLYRKLS